MHYRKFFQLTILALLAVAAGCSSGDNQPAKAAVDTASLKRELAPRITTGGAEITFAEKDTSRNLLGLDSAQMKDVSVTTTSPARIVFSTTTIETGSLVIPVFESSDLTQLFTDYTKSLNDELHAKNELDRLQDLLEHHAVAGKEVIQAQSDLRTIEVAIRGYESRMLQAGLEPSDLKNLKANTSLLLANVPESEIWTVQKGEDAQVAFEAFKGDTLHGHVVDIGKALDPATRTFNVRILMSDSKHTLRPGMFAKASFGIDITRKFVVPSASVVSVQGKSYVFVKTSELSFERREVELGTQTGDWFIVLSGLQPGETVVTRGSILLKGLSFGL
ncbi:MAG TPA: efflux RND transporter periplasmic adaptor subunit [Candidatus Kapabacteria bacterium]|nr:efflux RND transporter periplasmic adaptor subunit [Candidatus Kapabacteria bacterium]